MENMLSNISDVINNSPLLAYAMVFVGGLISASSPCVLAVIPLVIGFVGGYAEGNRRKAVTYSIVFAIGLSITFTILGAIASLVGGLFGDVGNAWYYNVAAVAVVMGLHLAGILRFRIPQPIKLESRHKGILGAFLLGLLFGIVSSPCATPVLAVILTFVASEARVVYGTSLLFTYAVAHCALIIVAGVFTGFVENYAKSKGVSNFSLITKRISGVLIFVAGIYILYINVL